MPKDKYWSISETTASAADDIAANTDTKSKVAPVPDPTTDTQPLHDLPIRETTRRLCKDPRATSRIQMV